MQKIPISLHEAPPTHFCSPYYHVCRHQPKITPAEAKDYIGETVEITGKLYGLRYLEDVNKLKKYCDGIVP